MQECGVNLETARLESLQKGQILRPLIPTKYIHNKFSKLDSLVKTKFENYEMMMSDYQIDLFVITNKKDPE